MRTINKKATAGSLDSSDVLVIVEPNNEKGIKLSITSPFLRQFGETMKKVAFETLKQLHVDQCVLIIQDQGAINAALKARIITAINRSE